MSDAYNESSKLKSLACDRPLCVNWLRLKTSKLVLRTLSIQELTKNTVRTTLHEGTKERLATDAPDVLRTTVINRTTNMNFRAKGTPNLLRALLLCYAFEPLELQTSSAYDVCTTKVDFRAPQLPMAPKNTKRDSHFANPDVQKTVSHLANQAGARKTNGPKYADPLSLAARSESIQRSKNEGLRCVNPFAEQRAMQTAARHSAALWSTPA